MGIFSLFKKKGDVSDATPAPETRPRAPEAARPNPENDGEKARQREIARATAAKIDAIESAMANDIFNKPEPAWGSGPRRARPSAQQAALDANGADTLPMLDLATTELLADEEAPASMVYPQTPEVIEEIAIMFANDQLPVAEHMLIESLAEVGKTDRSVWWMLFDLYQISGRQDDFDNIAIDYASQFETSPPTWAPPPPPGAEDQAYAGVTPTEVFSGVLDTPVGPQLQRLMQLAENNPILRLEFVRVTDVTPEGCALLHAALKRLRDRELIVAGAAELAELVHSTIAIGQREASEAPWLLLLTLLQLLNREKDFEETAMDYCVTYEVSPPSFEPSSKVATAVSAHVAVASERFMLPGVIDAGSASVFDAIDAYAEQTQTLLLDCSRLARVDYMAASQMLNRLRPLAEGRKIEFRDMNHLVAALFKLMGYADIARLFPHKY